MVETREEMISQAYDRMVSQRSQTERLKDITENSTTGSEVLDDAKTFGEMLENFFGEAFGPTTTPRGAWGQASTEIALDIELANKMHEVINGLNEALADAGYAPMSEFDKAALAALGSVPAVAEDMYRATMLERSLVSGLNEGRSVEQAMSDAVNENGGIGALGDHSSTDNDASAGVGWAAGPEEDGLDNGNNGNNGSDRDNDFTGTSASISDGGSFGCFVAGTPVLMADESERPIEAIKIGDMVMAFDGLGRLTPARVVNCLTAEDKQIVEVGSIRVTPLHRFLLADGSFKSIGEVSSDDQLVRANGEFHRPPEIGSVPGSHTVYNLTVEGLHTYVAGGFRVHNIKPVSLDLDGDGLIQTTGRSESSVFFDLDGDGYREKVGWVGPDDGFLVADLNGDGDISTPEELALALLTPQEDTDLEALAAYFDSNLDGVVNGLDSEFDKLRVWQDSDQDGQVDAGELGTLVDEGIVSIDVSRNPAGPWRAVTEMTAADLDAWGLAAENIGALIDQNDELIAAGFLANGNMLFGVSAFTRIDGSTGLVGDTALQQSDFGFRWDVTTGHIEFRTERGETYREITSATGVTIDLVTEGLTGVIGGGGFDHLSTSGADSVLLVGGGGDDVLIGGEGDDWLVGSEGADTLVGGSGGDTLFFDSADTVDGGTGYDLAVLTDGVDIVFDLSEHGIEALVGNDGADKLSAGAALDGVRIVGGAGNDEITGGDHADTLSGDAGVDSLIGGAGNDTLYVDENDLISGFVRGGAGLDTIEAATPIGVTFNLSELEAEIGIGGGGNDTLAVGAAFDGLLDGAGGDDVLQGGAGKDILIGGAGGDVLLGGYGFDAYVIGSNDEHTTIVEGGPQGSWGTQDRVIFADIDRFSDVGLRRDGVDLRFALPGGLSEGVIVEQYVTASADSRVEYLKLSDSYFYRIDADMTGGATDDLIVGTEEGETITGAAGNDVLYGNGGDDTLDGGAGRDVLIGGAGADFFDGGAEVDTVSYGAADTAVRVDLASDTALGAAAGDSFLRVENLIGSDLGDRLTGDAGANILSGRGGADVLEGGEGDDILTGGDAGLFTVRVKASADPYILYGVYYWPVMNVYVGDVLVGSVTVTASHGSGNWEEHSFTLYGVPWAREVRVEFPNDQGAKDLWIEEVEVNGTILKPEDALYDRYSLADIPGKSEMNNNGALVFDTTDLPVPDSRADGADALSGGAGADALVGGAGDDELLGGAGDDVLIGGAGADLLDGGAGVDKASYAGSAGGVEVRLNGDGESLPTGGDAGGDRLISIEDVTGSGFADTLIGDDAANKLSGGGGDDLIVGGAGADALDGGAGNDTLSYAGSAAGFNTAGLPGGVEIDLAANTARFADAESDTIKNFENVIGSADSDSLTGDGEANRLSGGAGTDLIVGGAGDDTLEGGAGADQLDGGEGEDTASYAASVAGVAIELAANEASGGDAAGDSLSGIENLTGSDHNDTLIGDAGANVLRGGGGDDVLDGAAESGTAPSVGDDRLIGGTGADRYIVKGDFVPQPGFKYPAVVRDFVTIDDAGDADSAIGDTLVLSTISSPDLLAPRRTGARQTDLTLGVFVASHLVIAGQFDQLLPQSQIEWLELSDGSAFRLQSGLVGGLERDIIVGGEGDETLEGGAAADELYGAGGFDTASYKSSGSGVGVNLATGLGLGGDAAGDRLRDIENLYGSGYADTLTGDAGDNVIEGGAGADLLSGGAGLDTLSYSGSGLGVSVDLSSGLTAGGDAAGDVIAGFELLVGSDFADSLTGDAGANTLRGGGGDDLLTGGGGDDRLEGGAGSDTAVFSGLFADHQVVQRGAEIFVTGADGADTLAEVELLRFADRDVAAGALPGGEGTALSMAQSESVSGRFVQLDDLTPSDALVYAVEAGPANGALTLAADGSYSYTPATGYAGPDSFSYRVTDGDGLARVVEVTVEVGAPDARPGAEFRVNSYTLGDQSQPTVAALADGSFVVTWHSSAQDGSLYGIYGQRYDGSGTALGEEFRINSTTGNEQQKPTVTGLADGGFVVTWHSNRQDGSSYGNFGQRYDANGATVGAEFQVNSFTGNNQSQPQVASVADGGFVVAWHSYTQDTSGNGIYGRRFDADGSAFGPDIQINSYVASEQTWPTVAGLADGGYVVTWQSYAQDSSLYGIFGQRYNASGGRAGEEFRINNTTAGEQQKPAVTALPDGGFVVTWHSNLQDGSGWGIYGQRYDANGLTAGPEFQVNSETASHQLEPAVTALSDGGFLVTWHSNLQDGSNYGVYGQRYDHSGAAVGAEFQVHSTTANEQSWPSVAALPAGDFVVTWQSLAQDGSSYGVYAKVFSTRSQVLEGGAGEDELSGGGGDDLIAGGAGADVLDGGDGVDTLSYAGSDAGVTVDLASGAAAGGHAAGDVISGFENLTGSAFADTLTGDGGANTLSGGAGDDLLTGGGGDDVIAGGAGSDTAVFSGLFADHQVVQRGGDIVVTGADGVDTLSGVETLRFADRDVAASGLPGGEASVLSVMQSGAASGRFAQSDDLTASNALVYGVEAGPAHGALTLNGDGSYSYQALAGYTGADNFSYRVTDGDGLGRVVEVSVEVAAPEVAGGAEFRVNSHTADAQSQPRVAALTDGGFVVTWTSKAQDGSLHGIYGQRYDAKGAAAGEEFQVNNLTAGEQQYPAVAALSDGGFVVTWHSNSLDGSSWGIASQRFDADGAVVGAEFQVSSYTLGEQSHPAVTALSGGGFLVTWLSAAQDGSGYGTYGQRYDAGGAAVGAEFQVNSYVTSDQFWPKVTGLSDGGFLVTWESSGQDSSLHGIYGQRYDVAGVVVGDEFRINATTANEQRKPSVTALLDGGFVVTWQSYTQDGSGWGVYGQRYDADGAALGAEFRVNSHTASEQYESSVTALSDGGFVVTWMSNVQDGSLYGVYGQRYDAAGTAVGAEFLVNSHTADQQQHPAVAALPDGDFIVTWQSHAQDGSSWGVYAKVFSSRGQILEGGAGNDSLIGDAGDDLIAGGAGADVLSGGDGIDTLSYAGSSAGVTVDLAIGTAAGGDAAGDTISGFENLTGSALADTLTGDAGDNILIGGAGADTLAGGAGDDVIEGGAGNDALTGGAGIDDLEGGTGDDLLTGGADDDVIAGGAGSDVAVFSGLFADYQVVRQGAEVVVTGEDGVDRLSDVEILRFADRDIGLDALPGGETSLLSVAQSGAVSGRFLQSDDLTASAALVYALEAGPAQGALTLNADGSYDYTPAAGYAGPDSFSYRVTDGDGLARVVEVSVDVVAPGVEAGDEFQVNSYTASHQSEPSVAALAGGGFVVTWHSYAQDGSLYGIYGQRYDASGAALGAEFRINSRTSDEQQKPWVAALADGGFVVTWQDHGQDGSGWGIYGQRYDADGGVAGDEFRINSFIGNTQADPVIEGLSDGGFVAIWHSYTQDTSGWGVYGQRYNAAGEPVGSEFQVNSQVWSEQFWPDVTGLPDGGFVVTWQSYAQDGSVYGIYGQRYDALGAAVGTEFRINTTTAGEQQQTAMATLSDGGFVVTWQDGGQDGSSFGVYGQRFDAAGAPVGAEFRANSYTLGDQSNPAVTALSDGGFLATWHSAAQDGSGYGIYGQRYDATGATVGSEFQINSHTGGEQQKPEVTALPDGGFVATWHSNSQDGSSWGVHAKVFSARGQLLEGGAGADALTGGLGDDLIAGGAGADALIGGAGVDTLSYEASAAGVTVDLASNAAAGGDAAGDTISGFEDLIGSAFADTLTGDGGANRLTGGDGDDILTGGAGDDVIAGGAGSDVAVFGGILSDHQVVLQGSEIVVTGPQGSDTLTGIEVLRFTDRDVGLDAFPGNEASLLSVAQSGALSGRFVQSDDVTASSALVYGLEAGPSHGSLVVNPDGSYSYTPVAGYAGADNFSYRVTDGDGLGRVVEVIVEVAAPEVTGGREIRLNSYTAGDQSQPSVAALSDGGFVVTWHSSAQDGSLYGIYGQRYDLSGAALGDEFRVNTTTAGEQQHPTVVALSDGGFVATWQSNDGSSWGVYGQRYDANGAAVGGEFLVNSFTAGEQRNVAVTGLPDGGFAVTWHSLNQDGSLWGVYGQRYDAGGVAVGAEFQVNSYTASHQLWPSVAALQGGGLVATWESADQDSSGYGIYGQRYDASGAAVGTEFRVNSTTAGNQHGSSVTVLSDGGFVVAWFSNDDSSWGVYGQRYDASGATVGAEFRINSHTAGEQRNAVVTGLSDGGFVVTWRSLNQDGSNWGVYGQRYDAAGTAVGAEFQINSFTTGEQTWPSVAALSDGDFVVTWQSAQDGSSYGVYAKVFSSRGQVLEGGAGADALSGDAGDDLIAGGAGADVLSGGAGADTLSYAASGAGVTVDLASGTVSGGDAAGDTISGFENVLGSAFADTLSGDAGDNVLTGGAGADILAGGLGANTLDYADSATAVSVDLATGLVSGGEAEGDVISGFENVVGSGGDDSLTGDGGDNILTGNGGNDILDGGAGADLLTGGIGDDELTGGLGDDRLEGNAGADRLDGAAGADILAGGAGRDTLSYAASTAAVRIDLALGTGSGGDATGDLISGIEVVIGSAHGDTLTGDDGNNELHGGAGDDTLIGGLGSNTLDGGAGVDTASYAVSDSAVTVDLTTGRASFGGRNQIDQLIAIENVIGSIHADHLVGDDGANRLSGGTGNDTLDGGAGDDLLDDRGGADTYHFGAGYGVDVVSDSGRETGVVDVVQMGVGIAPGDIALSRDGIYDLILTLAGTSDQLIVSGQFAAVSLTRGTYGIDEYRFDGGVVWNRAAIEAMLAPVATDGNDELIGFEAADVLGGGLGDDVIWGGDGNDTLSGGAGNDELQGGTGNDRLDGGAGNDLLVGGSGSDTFVFGLGSGADTIREATGGSFWLSSGLDVLELTAGVVPADVTVSRGGASGLDLIIALVGTTDRLTIESQFENSGSSFFTESSGVESVRFTNLTTWDKAMLEAMTAVGTTGDDVITGTVYNDTLRGEAGNDTIEGLAGNDTLLGGDGDDALHGNDGADRLEGGLGSDTLEGGIGADVLDGGDGIDEAGYGNSASGVTVDLAAATGLGGDAEGDTFTAIENIVGSLHADLLTGDGGDNILTGGAGDDALVGGAGIDKLLGGAGNDTLGGGAGNDTLLGGVGADIYLFGPGSGADTIFDADSTAGVVDAVQVAAGVLPTDVTLTRSGPYDMLLSLDGTADGPKVSFQFLGDTFGIEEVRFADSTVWDEATFLAMNPTGTAGDDVITGTAYNDTILGQGGNDALDGLAGNDSLVGGDGGDTLDGGAGNDTLSGGLGADTFVFRAGGGADTITDYDVLVDRILLEGYAPADVTVSASGTDTLVDLGVGDQIMLVGVAPGELNPFDYGVA